MHKVIYPYHCSICEQPIRDNEIYFINADDEYGHYECVTDMRIRKMLDWLGVRSYIMGFDDDYEDYD